MDYKYTVAGNNFQMAGVVQFDSAISGNFQAAQTFDLGMLRAESTTSFRADPVDR